MKKLYIMSSGAGGDAYLTQEALQALRECEVIVSYTKYAKELAYLFEGKEVITSGMTQEIQRCQEAIACAKEGKTTAIISNGDVNVFGMATLIVELMDTYDLWSEIEIVSIAGVTSFLATASRLGAPVSQDFAIVSLSDRLTPKELIHQRLYHALQGDFIIGIYNPKSKTRKEPYQDFLNLLSTFSERIVMVASDVGRDDERVAIMTSRELVEQGVNTSLVGMSTLIIVGNSTTRLTKNGKVLTPRGYLTKYSLEGEMNE